MFEFYCIEFKAAPLEIKNHMLRKETGAWKLAFVNYALNEPTLKAIACVLPFLVQVDEVEFSGN
jgi:hypothetical protein